MARLNVGDTVRLIDRSFSVALTEDENGNYRIVPGYPQGDLPCLDKAEAEGYGSDACEYTVIGVGVSVQGMTRKGPRPEVTNTVVLQSNDTGAIIFTQSRFVETGTPFTIVAFNDDLCGMCAADRRKYAEARGW